MRGWLVAEKGSAEFVDDLPEPRCGDGEMVLAVDAAAANYADRLLIDGKHQIRPRRPFVAGLEVAGTVIESRTDVHPVGARVTGLVEPGAGCWAERCRVSPADVTAIPEGVDPVDAVAINLNAQTVWIGLHHRARVQPGDVVVVHAAAGGVGTMAVQLAKAAGATVLATCSATKTAVPAALGADLVVDNRSADWPKQLADAAPDGVDIVIDPVGGEVFERSLKLLRFEGRLVSVGFTSGTIPSMAANYALVKNLSLIGVFWEPYALHRPAVVEDAAAAIFALHRAGGLDACVTVIDHFVNARQRVDSVAAGHTTGKTVLVWDDHDTGGHDRSGHASPADASATDTGGPPPMP